MYEDPSHPRGHRMSLWWPEMHVKDNDSDAYAGKEKNINIM